jgi:hypothetical protein
MLLAELHTASCLFAYVAPVEDRAGRPDRVLSAGRGCDRWSRSRDDASDPSALLSRTGLFAPGDELYFRCTPG